jgi:hypothetical protein
LLLICLFLSFSLSPEFLVAVVVAVPAAAVTILVAVIKVVITAE